MKIQEVSVSTIEFPAETYPRGGFDNDTVQRYRAAGVDNLPPIEITHEYIGIDGYHRLMAHRLEKRLTIKAIVKEMAREDVLWEAAKCNAKHGRQLRQAEKSKLGRRFFGLGRTVEEIAGVLGVTQGTVMRWTKDLRDALDDERDAQILDMWLACHTQEEIAEAVGLERSTVAKRLINVKNGHLSEIHAPDSLQTFNLWNFSSCDDRYGMDYPGRIPGQIIENVLYYYTEPFDTVVDPMAGGGTTLDVCKAMYRRYRCYDVKPVRDDIKQHDLVADDFPSECWGCNLVFLDPPYWKQKQGDYSDDATNLANMPLNHFYVEMEDIFLGAYHILADDGYIAVIVGPTQSNGIIYDHALRFADVLASNFTYVNRIIVPYTTQQAKPYHVTDAQAGRYMLKLYRDLLIFQKVSDAAD